MNKAIKTIAYKHRRKQLHGASGTFKWLCEEYEESISLSKLEFEILKWLEKGGYKFIFRNPNDNLMAHNNAPKKLLMVGLMKIVLMVGFLKINTRRFCHLMSYLNS